MRFPAIPDAVQASCCFATRTVAYVDCPCYPLQPRQRPQRGQQPLVRLGSSGQKRELLDVLREPVECFVRGTHSGERSGGCAPKTSLRPQPPGFIDRAHSALRHYRIESLPAMANPAEAKFSLSGVQPRGLIQEQFPELAPVALERLVECWDNTAWLANRTYVFRFPRRQLGTKRSRRVQARAWVGFRVSVSRFSSPLRLFQGKLSPERL